MPVFVQFFIPLLYAFANSTGMSNILLVNKHNFADTHSDVILALVLM